MANNTISPSIAAKVNEIKGQAYAKFVQSEDVIERGFGYKIVRHQVSSGRNSVIYKSPSVKYPEAYCIVKAYRQGKDKVRASFKEEVAQIMRYVSGKCPQLISTFDMFYTNEKIFLMCDWAAKGEALVSLKQKSIRLNEEILRNWTIDILNAVNFLHGNAICHRNIAPNCLLLTHDNRVKIGTLGDAVIYCKSDGTLIKQKWSRFLRTSNWNQPPEVAKARLYDPRRADIWSVGATIYWFITRLHPIEYRPGTKMTKQLENRLSMMRKVTTRCQNFVRKMLTYQPSQRPTIAQAMQLEWISHNGGGTSGAGATETPASPSFREMATQEITVAEKAQEPGEAAGPEDSTAANEAANEASASKRDNQAPEGAANEPEDTPPE